MGKKFKITIHLIDNEMNEDIDIQKASLKEVFINELSNYAFDEVDVVVEEV